MAQFGLIQIPCPCGSEQEEERLNHVCNAGYTYRYAHQGFILPQESFKNVGKDGDICCISHIYLSYLVCQAENKIYRK